ncbi:hypothetical protein ACSQ67_016623 [Phaseolus vulgaris]
MIFNTAPSINAWLKWERAKTRIAMQPLKQRAPMVVREVYILMLAFMCVSIRLDAGMNVGPEAAFGHTSHSAIENERRKEVPVVCGDAR